MLHLWLFFNLWRLNYIFTFGVELYCQWKKITTPPQDILVLDHHFLKSANMKFISNGQNVFIYHLSTSRDILRSQGFFKWCKNEQKQILLSTPYNPIATVVFLADSVSFSIQETSKQRKKMIRSTYRIK